MTDINSNEKENKRIIREFAFDKAKQALVHPYVKNRTKFDSSLFVYLITAGHLWIYRIIEKYGYGKHINEIIIYAGKTKNSLLEWELTEQSVKELELILAEYKITFERFIDKNMKLMNFKKELDHSKNKEHPYHRLTRLLILMKYELGNQIIGELDLNTGIAELLESKGGIINAAYLGVEINSQKNNLHIIEIPKILEEIVLNNMYCHVENQELNYYPKIDFFISEMSNRIDSFVEIWYGFTDEEQVIISKLLYSLRLMVELGYTLFGMNGILSTFVTRALFDNFWQSKYLIDNNKVCDYRDFALDRMRLHILKRTGRDDVCGIDELLSEVENGYLDPIPIHGDYFTKSAREYAIKLGLKDEYDKYYEYNSEFIHASLTAVYSGLMKQCENPEHNKHLTINPGVSCYIDSMRHIFEIINMHVNLVNNYCNYSGGFR